MNRGATQAGSEDEGRARLPRRFRLNMATSYLRTGSTALITLVMTPVLIAGLGLEAFGIWVIVSSLAFYRDLLQFGFQTATPKYVAEYSALEDDVGLRRSIATSFWFLAGSGMLALVLGVGIAFAFPYLFDVSPDLRESARVLVLVMTLDFALGLPGAAFAGTLMGLQRFDLMNTTLIVIGVLQAAAMTLVIVLDGGLVALGVVTVAISQCGWLWRYHLARKLVPGLTVSLRGADRGLAKPFVRLSIWYGIEDAAYIVVNRLDTIVVGLVLGAGAAGIYAVGQRLALALAQLAQPVSNLFFPHSSELAAQGDAVGLRNSIFTGTRLILAVIAPLAITLAFLAAPIIDAWVGSDFEDAAQVTVFLAAAVTTWVLIDTGLTMTLGTGKARAPALIRASEAVLNLGLSVVLAHLIGLEGVAVATLVAAAAVNLVVLLPYICRHFEIPLAAFIGSIVRAHAAPAAAALLVGWLVTRLDPTSVLAMLAAGVAIVGAYAAPFLLTGLDSSERRALRERMRRAPVEGSHGGTVGDAER